MRGVSFGLKRKHQTDNIYFNFIHHFKEELEAFVFVLDDRILLSIRTQIDGFLERVHALEVFPPEHINLLENKESFKKLNWKYIKRPGGQAIRPPDWYKLQGAVSQVEKGDNDTECPMWTSNGSVDYGGKEQWEWWSKYKGKSADESKVFFVRVLEMANKNKKENFY